LTIHKPITPKGEGPENMKATMDEAYDVIEKELNDKKVI
jgi:1-acyl-sn-glycerol-3-phosphate acyltransferase